MDKIITPHHIYICIYLYIYYKESEINREIEKKRANKEREENERIERGREIEREKTTQRKTAKKLRKKCINREKQEMMITKNGKACWEKCRKMLGTTGLGEQNKLKKKHRKTESKKTERMKKQWG